MSEFKIRSDSVNVEHIMGQIRARIREKRGVDYTEDQIRELAGVKLERFLDPKNVRSDLLEHYRRRGNEANPNLEQSHDPDPDILYRSHRPMVFRIRRLLSPILKLFINVGELSLMAERSEHIAAKLQARAELDALTYEVLNNLVVEMTRLSIEVKNHKMRVESVAARLDFDERRARALEEAVRGRSNKRTETQTDGPDVSAEGGDQEKTPDRRRRSRRRRGRRRPPSDSPVESTESATATVSATTSDKQADVTVDAAVETNQATGTDDKNESTSDRLSSEKIQSPNAGTQTDPSEQ